MNNLFASTLLCLSLALSSNSYTQTTAVLEYSAIYKARANGIAASAERSLTKLADNSYRLSNIIAAKLAGLTLANLEQSSEFTFKNGVLIPRNYSYLLTGISKASHAIIYNWETQLAISSEGGKSWQLQLADGVLDRLSVQFALRQALNTQSSDSTELEFNLISADEIKTHRYRVMGNELLATPMGNLNTVKLRRLRKDSDKRVSEIWLAREWNFLLVRMEQTSGSGLRIKLELESAVMGGITVTPSQ